MVHRVRNSVFGRKFEKLKGECLKRILPRPSSDALREAPPVLVNSFPKSGTHLLYQLFEEDSRLTDHGEFLASTPSLTMSEVSLPSLKKRIGRIQPSELLRGHLFYADDLNELVGNMGVVHFFIYRDPRDVVCSEAHYLASMNRWHRLHRPFAAINDSIERIRLAIDGIGNKSTSPYYPDINLRYRRYLPWISDGRTCAVRFEDLSGEGQVDEVGRILSFYIAATGLPSAQIEARVAAGLEQINPSRSHTFRQGGGVRSWERCFDERMKDRFKEVAGPLLIELGYESDLNW